MIELTVEPSILRKSFKAPMALVYQAWTKPEHLCNWQVPDKSIQCHYVSADIRTGGSALHKMTMPNGHEMWILTKYQELSPNHTIVFMQFPSNENGDILPPPMPNWPKEIQARIELTEENGVTHMAFIWQPINPTADEAEAWEVSRPQHGKGWNGSFELLVDYLQSIK